MIKNSSILFWLLVVLSIMSSCKSLDYFYSFSNRPVKENLFKKIDLINLPDTKISYEALIRGEKVNGHIKIIHDSVIWINVKKFGVEAFRILIQPDTTLVLDRLKKRAYSFASTDLNSKYGIPLSFSGLENLLHGFPFYLVNSTLSTTNEYSLIVTKISDVNTTQYVNSQVHLDKLEFEDYDRGNKGSITLSRKDSFLNKITILGIQQIGEAIIEYEEIEPLKKSNIRFKIPKKYEQSEL